MITDSHAHLFWRSFDPDRPAVLQRAREAGVERMIIVGTDLATSREALGLCADEEGLYPTAGVHPHDAESLDESARVAIAELCERPDCVGVGETGLDYFKEYSPAEQQREAFAWHLELAGRIDKPVVVHCRDAHDDCARIIADHPGARGVMHCYSMGPEELGPYLDAGYYISFSGVVTYPRNDANREAATLVPSDRLLVETDCPFLSPQSRRGRRNEPAHVIEVLQQVAELRETDHMTLARTTSANAARLFDLGQLP